MAVVRDLPRITYLEDNQSGCIDVRLRRGDCLFHTKLLWNQEFWRHKRHRTTLQLRAACNRLDRVGDHHHKTKIRKEGPRRGVVGDEDIRLRNIKTGIGREKGNTDPFQVTVRDLAAMEVLQTLGCSVQLLSHFGGGSGRESGVTYQLQSVSRIGLNELHDIAALHPL